jgi:hypothetical protein
MIAFLLWNLVYMTKGGWIDIDPINVYFWLFAGMLLRAAALDRGASRIDARNRRTRVRQLIG